MKWKKNVCLTLVLLLLVSVVYNPESQGQAKSKLKLNKTNLELNTGESFILKLNDKKINKKVKWSSKNKKIATVSFKGRITGVNKGKTVIYGKYKGKKYNCKVKVREIKEGNKVNGQIEQQVNAVNTPDAQISQVQSTTVPTAIPILQPTTQPTATPIPTPTLDPYLALRDYVLTSSNIDDNGNHYYEETNTVEDSMQYYNRFVYNKSGNCFDVYLIEYTNLLTNSCCMKVDLNKETDVVGYYFKLSYNTDLVKQLGYSDIEKAFTVNKKQFVSNMNYVFFTNETDEKKLLNSYNKMANASLNMLILEFAKNITRCNITRLLAGLNGEYTLADFGFTNYEIKSSK